ncbi:MAG: beta-propeller fold lactonase family protein [Eubacteriales bacterium]|nr:beta-propeller fold lactonase family protein [Eubacteriales bacterium]
MSKKVMAYVGSYCYNGKNKGISIFDVDLERGKFTFRKEIDEYNCSYIIRSRKKDKLYAVSEYGVTSYIIKPDGDLEKLNTKKINGMRGCHLSVSMDDRFLCVAGYHDGKCTILRINEDGSLGKISHQFYDQGFGSVAERTFRPHISCCRITTDGKYLFSVDSGIDQIRIFRFDENAEMLEQVSALRCELGSSPRFFRFSPDGKYMYLIYEIKDAVEVYSYEDTGKAPVLKKVKEILTTTKEGDISQTAAAAMRVTKDGRYMFVSNAGENTVSMFKADPETGDLEMMSSLPISGDYPKDISLFPDEKHLAVANYASNELSFFKIDYEKGLLIMSERNIPIPQPNSIRFITIEE